MLFPKRPARKRRNLLQRFIEDLNRKSIEPIALRYRDEKAVRTMQLFLKDAPWDDQQMKKDYQSRLLSQANDPKGMFTVMDLTLLKITASSLNGSAVMVLLVAIPSSVRDFQNPRCFLLTFTEISASLKSVLNGLFQNIRVEEEHRLRRSHQFLQYQCLILRSMSLCHGRKLL